MHAHFPATLAASQPSISLSTLACTDRQPQRSPCLHRRNHVQAVRRSSAVPGLAHKLANGNNAAHVASHALRCSRVSTAVLYGKARTSPVPPGNQRKWPLGKQERYKCEIRRGAGGSKSKQHRRAVEHRTAPGIDARAAPLHLCAKACGMDTAMQPCATARCRPWRGSVSPHSTNLLVVLAFVRARRKRGPEAEVGACRCTCVLEPCRVFWSWTAAWQWLWPVCMYV